MRKSSGSPQEEKEKKEQEEQEEEEKQEQEGEEVFRAPQQGFPCRTQRRT